MDIDGDVDMRADRLANERANRQVRHVMVVHHVEMDPIGSGGHDVADFFAEAGEIRR